MSTDQVDEFHRHEVMDRTNLILNLLSTSLEDHPAMDSDMSAHLVSAMRSLYKLYQLAGDRHLGGKSKEDK